jgi:radical SAM protein (TIGR01212 family)
VKEILTFGRYYKNKIGKKVKKLPINLSGLTCPNIDGRVGKGGCIYCLNESFSPYLFKERRRNFLNFDSKTNPFEKIQLLQIKQQYLLQLQNYKKKGYEKFIAYFQSFTNTYAPLDILKTLYEETLQLPDLIGISIGTRSDCVNVELLDYLSDIAQRGYEVWIEYGVQSVFDSTLKTINRGHNKANMEYWIKETKKRDIMVCAHLIFGLPKETKEMMLQSVREVLSWGIDSIKIHPLYIVKNTQLSIDYRKGRYKPIALEDYLDILTEAVKMIFDKLIIQRVTAGTKNGLIAPKWCKEKNFLMKMVKERFLKEGMIY